MDQAGSVRCENTGCAKQTATVWDPFLYKQTNKKTLKYIPMHYKKQEKLDTQEPLEAETTNVRS